MNLRDIDFTALSIPQRILLAEMLWDSVNATPESVPLTEAQRHELERRLAALHSGEMATVPWEEARDRLHALLT